MNWDEYFIGMAEYVSTKSKDRSTKVGAVIVAPDNTIVSTGFNGFPRGVNDNIEDRHERPKKYNFTEHAERNAILAAAKKGSATNGCTLYLNFEPIPCCDCTKAIIQSGIIKVVGPNKVFAGKGDHWNSSLTAGEQMLTEAGIEMIYIK